MRSGSVKEPSGSPWRNPRLLLPTLRDTEKNHRHRVYFLKRKGRHVFPKVVPRCFDQKSKYYMNLEALCYKKVGNNPGVWNFQINFPLEDGPIPHAKIFKSSRMAVYDVRMELQQVSKQNDTSILFILTLLYLLRHRKHLSVCMRFLRSVGFLIFYHG